MRFFYIIIFFLYLFPLNAQIMLEHDYSNGIINYVDLDVSGEKYYLADKANNRLMIYNLDHSIFKTINLPASSADLQEAYCVSENLFTLDGKICAFVIYLQQSPFTYTGKVVNEDGDVLETINDANWALVIQTETNVAKLLVRKYTSSYQQLSAVYSLPGEVSLIDNFATEKRIDLMQSYPNPANGTISIPYKLSSEDQFGEIIIFNVKGEIVKKLKVDKTFSTINLTTGSFSSGVYSYYLKGSSTVSKFSKFVVTK